MVNTPLTPDSEYPEDWDKRRRKVYQRDNYRCQNCKQGGGPNGKAEVHAHHIVPVERGGTHKLDNIVTLCSRCHSLVHNRPLGSLEELPSDDDSDDKNKEDQTRELESDREYKEGYQNQILKVGIGCIELLHSINEVANRIENEADKLDDYITSLLTRYTVVSSQLEEARDIYKELRSEMTLSMFNYSRELNILLELDKEAGYIIDEARKVSKSVAISIGFCPNCSAVIPSDSLRCEKCDKIVFESMPGRCPDCGIEVSEKYDFCPACETDLSDVTVSISELKNSRIGYAAEQMNKALSEISDRIIRFLISLVKAILSIQDDMEVYDWNYCPHCGDNNSVWIADSEESQPFCILCRCEWKWTGIIWKKLEITTPESESAKKSKRNKGAWAELGSERNEREKYREYYENSSGEEAIAIINYVNNIVL
jgi:hypothetical protein